MDKLKLTKTAVEKLKPVPKKQVVYWDSEITGFGVRVSPGGSRAFFYQGRYQGENFKRTLGTLGKLGYTAVMARDDAGKVEAKLRLGIDPREVKIREPVEGEPPPPSFGDLMLAYVELLELQGKVSARNVNNQVKADIQKAHPKLWKKPAAEIDLDDCMHIVGTIKDKGKLRQADKIRAYIRTAFSEAINSRGDVNMPASMRKLKLTFNPARDMRKVKGSSNARDRALSVAEFRAYWKHVQELPIPKREIAMLHVITGGQRQKQLSRVTWADVDRDAPSFTIWDGKGRRSQPRRHIVPLLPQALEAMDAIGGSGPYAFSCNGGESPMNDTYLPYIVTGICEKMGKAGELEGEPFTAGTIRATIETRLMKKPYRVSSDVLGQLLSHGMGGVQQRHYQHDDFEEEKLEALEKLWRLINDLPEPLAQVVELRATA
jgi:integrase